MKLYSYYRSSAAYRVRIALNLKALSYQYEAVNLLHSEQKSASYMSRNPQGLLPALELDDGEVLAQSVAILEWLEESHPQPALLPETPLARAKVRSLVNNITCDIHPLNNLSIMNYMRTELSASDNDVYQWYCNWVDRGFSAIEQSLVNTTGGYCFGENPTLADVCLVPQVYNARRFKVPMEPYPKIRSVVEFCNSTEPFAKAAPEAQPDA
ncbi:MAG: maleylacetoacetate isomerase [Pseudomonadota bacterium]